MTRAELFLKCIEIADKPGREHTQVLATAKAYYEQLVGIEDESASRVRNAEPMAKKPEAKKPHSK